MFCVFFLIVVIKLNIFILRGNCHYIKIIAM